MSYVQIIGWHDYFVPPSLQIFSEGCYFIFNCGENSQRFRLSNKLGLAKIRYIFLTNLSAHSFMGLPSFILSLDGCNTSHVTIFGPRPLKKILDVILSTFLELKIQVTVHEVDSREPNKLVSSNSLTIYGFSYNEEPDCNFTVDPVHYNKVGYFVQFDKVPGTFDPELAKQYGVLKGPDFGRLKKGFDVTLPDGTILRSDQVCDSPTPGNQLLILHKPYDFSSKNNLTVDPERLLYTFYLHTSVYDDSKSKVDCNQTLDDSRYITFPPYYNRTLLYHSIFPNLFPTLSPSSFLKDIDTTLGGRRSGCMYPPLTRLYVHPPKKVNIDTSDSLTNELDVDFPDLGKIEVDLDLNGPKLTFLGTGCSVPSVYRNVSSILIQIYDNYSVLLDAGEGTVLQILFTSGSFEDFVNKLISIKIIFISHSHADHHLGLYYILALQTKFRTDGSSTLVICSDVIMLWLKTYNENICKLNYEPLVLREDLETEVFLGVTTLKLWVFKVDHIFDSFGIKIEHEEVGSLVYSGDTRPCENLVTHAQDADILIHEATFTDEFSENAIRNFHTTISEAIEIGNRCKVKNLFVTHFSQRFQSIPNEYNLNFNLVMASDLMTIPIGELDRLGPHLKRFDMLVKDLVK